MAFVSPGHQQQPWVWKCRINIFLSSMSKDFLKPWHLSIKNWVGGAVKFLVVGTISTEDRPPQDELCMVQYLTYLKHWPIKYMYKQILIIFGIWEILANSLIFGQYNFNRFMVKLFFTCWNYSPSSSWYVILVIYSLFMSKTFNSIN